MYQTVIYKNHTIEIKPDNNPISPRENDNICEILCYHSRYTLGDKQYRTKDDLIEDIKFIKENGDFVYPLYLYDHSGITISLKPFSCRWDSSQVGYVVVRKDKLQYEFPNLTEKEIAEKAEVWANIEVQEYDVYLRGDICGYVIDDYDFDSCWGYYNEEGAIADAKAVIDSVERKNKKERFAKIKKWIKNKVPFQYRSFH